MRSVVRAACIVLPFLPSAFLVTAPFAISNGQAAGTSQEAAKQVESTENEAGGRDSEKIRFHAQTLLGKKVFGLDDEELGEIRELVVDLDPGRVRYGVLSYGGFIGIGEKLFAVPYGAFKVRSREDDVQLTLSIGKERLREAPGFSPDDWPSFADRTWSTHVDKFYDPPNRAAGDTRDENPARGYRLGKLLELPVTDAQEEEIGSLHDFMIDGATGRIVAAHVSGGGILGVGDEVVQVPLGTLALRKNGNESEYRFVYTEPEKGNEPEKRNDE